MAVYTDIQNVNTPRPVVRGVNSQPVTEVGGHYLRNSFPDKYLQKMVAITNQFFKSKPIERHGVWGYECSYRWPNGVMILFDCDDDKACSHGCRAYFECGGNGCDELTPSDLILLMQILKDGLEARGERIDIFLDDFARRITPQELQEIAKRGDYSRFRQFHIEQSYDHVNELVYDAIVFGSKKKDWLKQFEVYDKGLQTKGERDCIRMEAKFREDKADTIFTMLAGTCGNLDAYALLCGSIVAGSITFIHRTGDKNISRLDEYEFWKDIKEGLGDLHIRSEKKVNTVTGIMEWARRQVAPNLAVLSKIFKSEQVFFAWLLVLLCDGEARMNENQRYIVDQYAGSFDFKSYMNPGEEENRYINAMCKQKT